MNQQAKTVLQKTFGYESFRPLQEEVISNVLGGKDTLVIMPTGGGKSLCYQIPAMVFDGLTLVISPLISLMKDQVEQLEEFGIPSVYLNSSLSPAEYERNVGMLKREEVKLLYLAPETRLMQRNRALLGGIRVGCVQNDSGNGYIDLVAED